jgi:hypothetical protein
LGSFPHTLSLGTRSLTIRIAINSALDWASQAISVTAAVANPYTLFIAFRKYKIHIPLTLG